MKCPDVWRAIVFFCCLPGAQPVVADSLQLPSAPVPERRTLAEAFVLNTPPRQIAWANGDAESPSRGDARSRAKKSRTKRSEHAAAARRPANSTALDGQPAKTERESNRLVSATSSRNTFRATQATGGENGNPTSAASASPASLDSALYPPVVTRENPYGDMYDTHGLRPYKPGVRYDNQSGERDSSFFGLIFGNGRR